MFDDDLAVKWVGPKVARVTEPLAWHGERDTFTVPAGFVTDFASVPRFLHWLVLPYGAYTRAAVLHDWLLTELAEWVREGRANVVIRPLDGSRDQPLANSRDADGIFRRAMRDLGVSWAKRWAMWAAVRLASLFSPYRAYGRDFRADAAKVLGIALATGPVILPGAVGVLLSLGAVRIYTWLSGGAPAIRRTRRGRPVWPSSKGTDHGRNR